MTLDDQFRVMVRTESREALREALVEVVPTLQAGKGGGADSVQYLTVEKAAARLSVSKTTIREWLSKGWLRRYGVGALVRVRVDELDALMQNGAERGSQPGVRKARVSEVLARYGHGGSGPAAPARASASGGKRG